MTDWSLLRQRARTWAVLHLSPRHHYRMLRRARLAARYLSGDGLEIGALHMPVRVPRHARVRYVDYQDRRQRELTYPQLAWVSCVPVSVVDDGESLATVPDGSVDFVIANHVIEHCEDPISAIEAWLRVLRPDGVLFMAVPDMRFTFDRHRRLTPSSHVIGDHVRGPEASRRAHWREFAAQRGIPERDVEAWIERNLGIDQRPHFHVWTLDSFVELLDAIRRELDLPFTVEEVCPIAMEFVIVLRKRAA